MKGQRHSRPPQHRGAETSRLAQAFGTAVQHHNSGRLDEADRICREILKQQPRNGDVLNLLGANAGRRGQSGQALEWFRKAAKADRRNPVYQFNLGMALHSLGDTGRAERQYRRAIELRSGYVDALVGLGMLLATTERTGEAEKYLLGAVRAGAGNPLAHNNLAGIYLSSNRMDEAKASAREALKLAPNLADAHNNLGAAHLAQEEYDDAANCLRKALELKPDYAEALNNLGMALLGLSQPERGIAKFRAAMEARPDYVDAESNLGLCFWELGRSKEAVTIFEAVLERRPGNIATLARLARALSIRGNMVGAIERYEEILRYDPGSAAGLSGMAAVLEKKGDYAECYRLVKPLLAKESEERIWPVIAGVYGRIARRFDEQDEAAVLIGNILDRQGLPRDAEYDLRFTLGKIYDDTNKFDRAFANFKRANELRAQTFDGEKFTAQVDRITEFFTPKRAPLMPQATNRSDLPVFIVGMPRSGTSLTEQILACHPGVHGAGELEEMGRIIRETVNEPDTDEGYPDCLGELDQAAVDRLAEGHLTMLRSFEDGVIRVTDKMPYNFVHLGMIARLFPNARVVHCARDPLDTCLSCYFQNFWRGNNFSFDLAWLGQYHRQYQRLMTFWRESLEIPIYDIQYEKLVNDLEGESRKLVDFLGLDWDPACLEFHTSKRLVHTASYEQVRQPIYNRSAGRWRRYERHLGPLREALGDAGA